MFKPTLVPPSSVYAGKLSCLCLGYPLWYPEPDDKIGEVQIGDVGYVSDGAFTRLFNVRADVPPVTFWPKPFDNPEPLAKEFLMIDPRPKLLVPGCYRSHGVEETHIEAAGKVNIGPGAQAGLAFGYECREDSGAMVCLRHEAIRQDMIDNRHIREYILRHHDAWCDFAIGEIGLQVEPHHIMLISGWVKTTGHWTATSFMSATSGFHATLEGDVGGAGGLSVEYRKKYSSTGLKISRRGINHNIHEENEAGRSRNQCLFLRRYMVKKRLFFPAKIEAAAEAGPPDADRSGDGSGSAVESADEILADNFIMDQIKSPLDNLLDYMLEHSGANAVIACDADIDLLFPDYEVSQLLAATDGMPSARISLTDSFLLSSSGRPSSLIGYNQDVPDVSCSKMEDDQLHADPNESNNHLSSLSDGDRAKLLTKLGLSPRNDRTWFLQNAFGPCDHQPAPDLEPPGTKRQPIVNAHELPSNEKSVTSTDKQDLATEWLACLRCREFKVKCEPSLEALETCKRCYRSGQECTNRVGKRGHQRKDCPSRIQLLIQIREQTQRIQALSAKLERIDQQAIRMRAQTSSVRPDYAPTEYSFIPMSEALVEGEAFPRINLLEATRTAEHRTTPDPYHGSYNREDQKNQHIKADEANDVGDSDEHIGSLERDDNHLSSTWRTRQSKTLSAGPPVSTASGLKYRRNSLIFEEGDDVTIFNHRPFQYSSRGLDTTLVNPGTDYPNIVRRGILTAAEAEILIQIYWDYMNPSVGLLDPTIYTTVYLMRHSPFLFTVICGITSRFYNKRPEIYQQAMMCAQRAAGVALIEGEKSVDVVHAYLLLALYPAPSRRWEDDRSWIYLGVAIQMAMDLNLHYPQTAMPKNEMHARLMLNRTRAWLTCFNLDLSMGLQYGKDPIIGSIDCVAAQSAEWWKSSEYNLKGFDIHLSCNSAGLMTLRKFREKIYSDPNHPTGFNKNLDIADIASKADDELADTWAQWSGLLREHADPNDPQYNFRTGLLQLAYSYARITVMSFGFQYAFGKSNVGQDVDLLHRCLRAAHDVIAAVLDDIARPGQKIFLRHGPEAQGVFVTFVCAFLIKFLQARLSRYVNESQRKDIRDNVRKIVELFGSPEVAIDDRHSLKLYSRFIQDLLEKQESKLERRLLGQRMTPLKRLYREPATTQKELVGTNLPIWPLMSLERGSRSSEPYIALTEETTDVMSMDTASEFFAPSLPVSDILSSMNNLPIMEVPGFAWMSIQQPDFQLDLYSGLPSA